ncbi:MAG: threonine synthase [Lachnospiraceae bacterium]|nr:threonine synthase [Lachnospiraceae bacterium]
MDLKYISTRGDAGIKYSPSEAVIKGLADDGGLFVPEYIPKFDVKLSSLVGKGYKATAYEVLKLFFTDFSKEELMYCIDNAYDDKFDTDLIAPLCEHDGQYFLELFHGPTIAFKDMALSILPHLLKVSLSKNGIKEKIVIMTATSGDTGKAALAAFSDVSDTRIIVFYPKGGVSRIQELQMITQKGGNTKVIGVKGNFDDCQSGVKKMFNDDALKEDLLKHGYRFSSANSINIGRLFPQVAYYFYAYIKMIGEGAIKEGDALDFVVPTGNFGNILAAYYAKQMGLNIGKLICASNENKVLYDFFETGTYDRRRDFILTTSPSMDILISSNLERLIYHSLDGDHKECAKLMRDLTEKGVYTVSSSARSKMADFTGIFATEEQVADTIRRYYERSGYVLDPHTAVAAYAGLQYKDKSPAGSVIISTASPYKFVGSVLKAIDPSLVADDDFKMADRMSRISKVDVPAAINSIRNANILHDTVCTVEDMENTVRSELGLTQIELHGSV